MTTCPCNSRKDFSQCCGPYLAGEVAAPTAEALMRSRYSAYVNGNFNYLLDTWHASSRRTAPDFGALAGIRWTGLEIVDTEAGGPTDGEGMVEFIVRYESSGSACMLHEKSRFIREEERWYYESGEIVQPQPVRSSKTGRNEPCPCGSGRKYKKCCLIREKGRNEDLL